MGIAVGIDLGTTNSCVALVQADRATVVADRSGRRIHPSIVSYLEDGSILAGHTAKERIIIDSPNTVYSFKRLIGRDFTSGEMQRVLSDLPYEVHLGPGDIPSIKVHGREVSLPEVSAMMLKHLRTTCSETLGIDIKEAVITVPANFNDVQRSSTKVAGRIAGFNVLRILNEPTAAALAYGVGEERSERIAIYDFGGGTFDITIVEVSDDIFEVLSTAGDTFLGGDDFDKAVLKEMRTQFERQHNVDLISNNVAIQRMRSVAEQVKCQLSSISEVQATLRQIANGANGVSIDFDFKMKKFRFEQLCRDLVARSLSVCDEALNLAGVDRNSLDALILVGGTTRIPLVRKMVSDYFAQEPMAEINPDEVVAIGAAIQAFSLTGEQLDENISLPAPAIVKKKAISTLPPRPIHSEPPPAAAPKPPPVPPVKPSPMTLPVKPSGTMIGVGKPEGAVPPRAPSSEEVTAHMKRGTLPQKAEPDLTEIDEADFENVDLALGPETVISADPKDPSDKWPAVLGTPSESETSEPAKEFSIDDMPMEPVADERGDDSESWFGVLGDLPIPGAEGDSVAAIPDSLENTGAEALDGLADLAPPPHSGAPSAEPPNPFPSLPVVDSKPAESAEALPGEKYPIRAKPALLLDVTPRGLGVATAGGFYDIIIERNAAIPVEQTRLFTTSSDDQTQVSIDIYQGEGKRIEENTKLGEILLTDIRPAPRGEIKINVTFEMDTDGILGVFAKNEETGDAQSTRIAITGTMDDDQVEALVEKYAQ